MNLSTRTRCLLGFAAILSLPSWAAAEVSLGTVTIDHASLGASDALSVYGGGQDGADLYAGVYMLEKTGGTGMGTTWPNGPLPGFCIELNEYAPNSTVIYNVIHTEAAYDSVLGETFGTAKAGYLQELWGKYYDPAWAGAGPFTGTQNVKAAAFAAAVWEIVYEDLPVMPLQWNVNADGAPGIAGFRAQGVNSVLANSWLHSLNGTGPKATLAVFTNNGSQNYLVAVPEPATLVLLGLGGAFSLVRHRKGKLRKTC